jgi:signal transduction histidine kinase
MQLTDETALGGMTAALAHEIKNPAALALAHVGLIRAGAEDINKCCDNIERALLTIVDLAHEMLSVSYGLPLAYDFDLPETLSEVLSMYQAAWPGVRFLLTPGTEPLTLRAHEVSVRMVLTNLIKNAVEAVTADNRDYPEVSVCAGKKETNVYIIIRDNGPGYDETNKKPHGNGLGLPIARWLLERMGGCLEMRPGILGGCEAVICLPEV